MNKLDEKKWNDIARSNVIKFNNILLKNKNRQIDPDKLLTLSATEQFNEHGCNDCILYPYSTKGCPLYNKKDSSKCIDIYKEVIKNNLFEGDKI